jgi:hypothetical protein
MGYSTDDRHRRGDLFNASGKWKYTVGLDYSFPGHNWTSWDLWKQARMALTHATAQGLSGVSISKIPDGWTMVVLDPYSQHSLPIVVTSED